MDPVPLDSAPAPGPGAVSALRDNRSESTRERPGASRLPTGAMGPGGPLSLRRNFSWTFAGNVTYAACQWGMLALLAKLGTPEMVGQFALALAITAPIMMLANLHLRTVQATDATDEYAFGDYLGLRTVTAALGVAVVVLVVAAGGYRRETALVIIVVALAKGVEAMSDIFHGLLQRHERMDWVAISDMLKGPLSLGAMGLGVVVTGRVLGGVLALGLAWMVLLCAYDVRRGRSILALYPPGAGGSPPTRPRWRADRLRPLVILTLPMGVVGLLTSLLPNIPRYVVEHQFGERELGIFAALAYVLVAGHTVVNALSRAALPRLATYYSKGRTADFRRLVGKMAAVGVALGAGGILVAAWFGRELLTLIYTPEYGDFAPVFTLVMTAGAIGYVAYFLWGGITAARYLRVQVAVLTLAVVTMIASSVLLIPSMGLQGAAVALVVTAGVQLVGNAAVLVHALHRCGRGGR